MNEKETSSPPKDVIGYESTYRHMAEPELMDLTREYENLSGAAQSALRAEFQRRSLEPPLLDEPVDSGALVTVQRYRDLSEAFVARAVLQGEGIPCFLCDENLVRLDWGYSNFIGGMRLQVSNRDAAFAEELLTQKAPATIDVPGERVFVQPICPRCGSDDIIAYDAGLKTAAAGAHIGLPTRLALHRSDEEAWHCMHCGLTWAEDPTPEDPLL